MTNFVQTAEPCDKLKPYISCYYFIKSEDPNFSSKHYSFPHTYNALTIYKDVTFKRNPASVNIYQSEQPNVEMFIQIKKQAPLLVDISGKINRATILFKDFGINHFVEDSLERIMNDEQGKFTSWKKNPAFDNFTVKLFSQDNILEKAKIIDQFLLLIFKPLQVGYLPEAVALLCDFEQSLSIKEIASKFEMPIRTFNRNFKAVLGVSPVEYRIIAQFRHSLSNKFFQSEFKRLTDIGYNSHFYDQSYFNKIFLKLTGSNPKRFFNSVARIGDDKLIFRFPEK